VVKGGSGGCAKFEEEFDAGVIAVVVGGVVEGFTVIGTGARFQKGAAERGVVVEASGAVRGGERVIRKLLGDVRGVS
jgi:hypothetical protein